LSAGLEKTSSRTRGWKEGCSRGGVETEKDLGGQWKTDEDPTMGDVDAEADVREDRSDGGGGEAWEEDAEAKRAWCGWPGKATFVGER
jgi:hypothetical protein